METSFALSPSLTKEERYRQFIPLLATYLAGEEEAVSVLANVSAALREAFGFFWVGFYLVKDADTLVLGPFQGSAACFRIRKGRGVCGTCWAEERPQVVPDVEQFPGHIACSSLSRSEIVVPLLQEEQVVGVLDIDSDQLNQFDDTDRRYLEQVTALVTQTVRLLP
ncbi:MAG: GAF domain-containing protein [Bacteroides sp.]